MHPPLRRVRAGRNPKRQTRRRRRSRPRSSTGCIGSDAGAGPGTRHLARPAVSSQAHARSSSGSTKWAPARARRALVIRARAGALPAPSPPAAAPAPRPTPHRALCSLPWRNDLAERPAASRSPMTPSADRRSPPTGSMEAAGRFLRRVSMVAIAFWEERADGSRRALALETVHPGETQDPRDSTRGQAPLARRRIQRPAPARQPDPRRAANLSNPRWGDAACACVPPPAASLPGASSARPASAGLGAGAPARQPGGDLLSQAPQRQFAVARLAARVLGDGGDQRTAAINQHRPLARIERPRGLDVEDGFHPRGGDVGVLAPRPRGAAGAQLDLGQRDREPRVDSQLVGDRESTFPASSKSAAVRPPSEWVEIVTVTVSQEISKSGW